MLTLDARVHVTCTETDQVAPATIVRINGNRVDVVLDQGGGDIIISMVMQKPGLCGQPVRAGIYHAYIYC